MGSSQTTPVVPPAASAASPWLSTPAHVVPADLDPFRADPATRGPGCGPGAPQPEHLHGHRLSLSGRAGAPTVTIRRNGTSHREAVLVEMTLFVLCFGKYIKQTEREAETYANQLHALQAILSVFGKHG